MYVEPDILITTGLEWIRYDLFIESRGGNVLEYNVGVLVSIFRVVLMIVTDTLCASNRGMSMSVRWLDEYQREDSKKLDGSCGRMMYCKKPWCPRCLNGILYCAVSA